ncbi:hypothetical protein QYM36_015016 [Artemia franciscana]|uniref:Uncharacterized protein n=1 Tax=Artemia franciscana TaxID=6661 RepID=A0AA88KU74_ARTSF|nr:hypothetical protein QYM36_015016 [Artemia franciscana]
MHSGCPDVCVGKMVMSIREKIKLLKRNPVNSSARLDVVLREGFDGESNMENIESSKHMFARETDISGGMVDYILTLFTSINICTRIFVTSATLIDNIFVMLKQNFKIHTPRALVNDVSDHCAVMVSCQLQITSTQSRGSKNARAYFDQKSLSKFKSELEKADWTSLDGRHSYAKWYRRMVSFLKKLV